VPATKLKNKGFDLGQSSLHTATHFCMTFARELSSDSLKNTKRNIIIKIFWGEIT
jgi:hypothetical protein